MHSWWLTRCAAHSGSPSSLPTAPGLRLAKGALVHGRGPQAAAAAARSPSATHPNPPHTPHTIAGLLSEAASMLPQRSLATRRAWRCWGLRCVRHLLDLHIGIPALEHSAQFAVEGLDARLEQQMCAAFRPLHLLLLAEALACSRPGSLSTPRTRWQSPRRCDIARHNLIKVNPRLCWGTSKV